MAAFADAVKGKIHIRTCALGNSDSTGIFFEGAGYASQLSQLGDKKIQVVAFDSLDIEVSFMKLHLERVGDTLLVNGDILKALNSKPCKEPNGR